MYFYKNVRPSYSVLLGWLTSSYLDYGNHEPEIYVQSIPKSADKDAWRYIYKRYCLMCVKN